MKLKTDWALDSVSNPLQTRLSGLCTSISSGLVPIDGPGGLRAVSSAECRAAQSVMEADFARSEVAIRYGRIKARIESTQQLQAAAIRRAESGEASLQAALAGDDDTKIVAARAELTTAVAEVETLRRENELLANLERVTSREYQTARTAAEKTSRGLLISEMHRRAMAARSVLLEALKVSAVDDAIGEWALCSYILSLQSGGSTLAENAAFQGMPESRRGAPNSETVSTNGPTGTRLVAQPGLPSGN